MHQDQDRTMANSSNVQTSIGTGMFSGEDDASVAIVGIEMLSRLNDEKKVLPSSIEESGTGGRKSSEDGDLSFVIICNKKMPRLNWTRLNYDEENHDNRRLVEHRKRDCQCEVCYRESNKLPPEEPIRQKVETRKKKLEDREIKRAKRKAKMEVKAGKQACIRNFFRY